MRKYSTVWASANELGGMMQDGAGAGDEAVRAEVLGVDDGAVDVGEDAEFVGHPGVVAVAGQAVADDALALLRVDEGFDHGVVRAMWRIQWSGITGMGDLGEGWPVPA